MTFSRRFRESDFMKKMMFSILAIVFVLALTACGSNKIDMTQPVFETENIKGVAVYSMPDFEQGIPVPDEDMDAVINWIGSFRIDKKAGKEGDKMDPGTGIRSFAIEYLDGTIVESDANTIIIDGTVYYMKSESRAVCVEELFAEKRAEADNDVLQFCSINMALSLSCGDRKDRTCMLIRSIPIMQTGNATSLCRQIQMILSNIRKTYPGKWLVTN